MNRNNYILECCVDSAESALEAAGGLIKTGPTGTNVNDVAVALLDCG